MFTGIVAEVGTVRHAGANASGVRLEVASSLVAQDLEIDASVNVAGACLTVVERDTHGFAVDVVAETLSRTTLGRAIRGTRVNLESAATPTTALGGHFVQGHVDATAKLVARHEEGGGAARRSEAALEPREAQRSAGDGEGDAARDDRLRAPCAADAGRLRREHAERVRVARVHVDDVRLERLHDLAQRGDRARVALAVVH